MKFIKLPYSPSITAEAVEMELKKLYPQKKISRFKHIIRIQENTFRHATVSVFPNPKKNLTQIAVASAMPAWAVVAIVVPIVFIGLGCYASFGNWATEVTQALNSRYNK
ncbi:MAG: hypothetical protein K2M31_06245 [Muribaculaceae bacterium]|nr:hypothetical protein [Muribaculaceae bacterium]